jgi:hypothetical protein
MAEKAKKDGAIDRELDHSVGVRHACGSLDIQLCGNYRSARLEIRRALFEYGEAVSDITVGYTKLIGVLRTKDDSFLWVVER